MTKIVVIGVDGATLNLMEKWMDHGNLPIFDKIRRNGVHGNLRSIHIIVHQPGFRW